PESKINNMLDAIWWTVATVTTVGYGDVVPISDIGRIMGIAYMLGGITILGMFLAQIRSSILGKNWLGKDTQSKEDNFTNQIKRIEAKQDKLFDLVRELKSEKNESTESSQKLLENYKRLLKEAENSAGLDEEKLTQQLEDIRSEFKRLTGKNIDDIV
ncbi:MAG: hypothetical protein GWN01_00230, partial [Nitrosopumilaceae archaeon]|nr:hypothetical protein [Nitrosopumilaceae archaeon]NIT99411.1 hypothetical protein [Nitrosopumilaceae archaeon]NIU86149.1 hypothetical protein [Nitrosopumilaceae archaeon]NIV64945.1 hypothetical protein [Nitrosopumilaceae archaeon]NIX60014.1 hypothetical protein [Nitrosopumilaceae archaeon]